MLKLPWRGKKSVMKSDHLFPYKQLFSKIIINTENKEPIKNIGTAYRDPKKKTHGVVKLEGVEKTFGKINVLNGVNLEIKLGKIIGIIGVSGSGKTTILRLIIGFYKPTSGVISFDGKDIKKQKQIVFNNFGFATQDNSFYKNLTVEENVRFFGKLYGLNNEFLNYNIPRVLGLVRLGDSRKILSGKLSSGMQKRLDIACAMIHDPTVLILDEPTEDLDPNLRAEILNLIRDINRNGTTVIFTTHLLGEAEYLCDEIAIIANGKVLIVGSPNDLRKSYSAGDKIHLVLESGNYEKYKKQLNGFKTTVLHSRFIVHVPKNQNSVKILKKILGLVEKNKDKIILADIKKPNLSEVFSNLTRNAKKSKK